MIKNCKHCIYDSLFSKIVHYKAKQMLFFEGATLDYVYRIKKGYIKINRMHASGEEKIFDILGPNDYVALIAVLQNKLTYIASAEALTDVVVDRIIKADVLKAYQSNSHFKTLCLNCAITRSTLFQDKLFQTSNMHTEDKILSTLIMLGRKFGRREKNRLEIRLPFNQTVLANIIGIRRETLSRKLSEMKKQHVIRVNENVYILDRM